MDHRAARTLLEAARARFALDAPRVARLQRRIAAIAAPTGDELPRARFVRERLRERGLADVRIDAAGNVIGRRAGASETAPVAVCAHLDTVFPASTPIAPRSEGLRTYAPGITDNARGLAGMLALAGALDALGVRTRRPIEFVATTGEEGSGDLRGARHYFATAAGPAAAAIALDGAGDARIIHRAVGARRYRIACRGTGGHSWSDHGMPNAVHAIAGCASRLAAVPLPASPKTALTVSRIGGGLSINSIPADAWLEVDARSTSAEVLQSLDGEIRAAAHRAVRDENAGRAAAGGALALVITPIGERPCGATPAGDPLVAAALATTRMIGRDPEPAEASTDASVPISLGIPAIAIGAGGAGGGMHTLDEWYEDTDGAAGLARACVILVSTANAGL